MFVLTPDTDDPDCSDYTLNDDANSCWLTVNDLSIYILQTGDGVAIDIYRHYQEMEDPIATTWAPFAEAE